jgi:hypothetical protein
MVFVKFLLKLFLLLTLSIKFSHGFSFVNLNGLKYLEDEIKKVHKSSKSLYEINTKNFDFSFEVSNSQDNLIPRPLKNQEILLDILKHKEHRLVFDRVLKKGELDKIIVVYCNTYAVFLMDEKERVKHSFLVSFEDQKLNIKSIKGT